MPVVPPNLDLSVDRRARMPLGAQLADRIRAAIGDARLTTGHRLPSVRELAEVAGVNVNTARAVYARLESEGLVSSEQGRGTFVAAPASAGGVTTRRELHRQIAELEAALVRLPPRPLAEEAGALPSPGRAALLSTEDLRAVRDTLLVRLRELDDQRAEVMQRLEELGAEELRAGAPRAEEHRAPRGSTSSLAGARIRWVGA